MVRALQNPAIEASSLEFFGLDRAPFARLSAPSSIYHAEQYSLLFDHLARAKAESDHLVVMRGADGCGKTTLLNRFLTGFNDEETFASIDDSCGGAADFYQGFFEQIGFKNIDGKLEELQAITREFLVHRYVVGDPVLLIIDNAQDMHPAVFHELRWLAEIQRNGRRVFSVVLSGTDKLRRVLDAPAMAEMTFLQRINFHVRAYSEEETADYIQYRLMLAGTDKRITFTPAALALVYRFTGGIPRRINRVCTMLLNKAHAAMTHDIDDAIVRAVAEDEQLPATVMPKSRRGRRRTDIEPLDISAETCEVEKITLGEPAAANNEKARRERVAVTTPKDANVSRLLDQIAELSAEIGNLKADKASSEDELRQALDEQKRELTAARSKATRAENRAAQLEETKSQLMQTSSQLRADLGKARKKANALAKAEQQLEKTEREKEKLLADLAELETLCGEIADRDAAVAALKDDLADLSDSDTLTQARLATLPEPALERADNGGPAATPGDAPIDALRVVRSGKIEQIFQIDGSDPRIMVGRGDDSDLKLESEFVSRHHALIFCKAGESYIEDLNSFNGTIVNGEPVARADIGPDDVIIIGEFRIEPIPV